MTAIPSFGASVLLYGAGRHARPIRLRGTPEMKMTWRTLGMVALLAGMAAPAAAQMTPITALNCTASNFPNCGWGNWGGDNDDHTLTRVGNGARFTLIPG